MRMIIGPAAAFLGFQRLPPTSAMAQEVEEELNTEKLIGEENLGISGEEEFIRYCGIYHGVDGNGSLAPSLRTQPADLTTISKRNCGGFPLTRVAETMCNGGEIDSHGSRDMPAWGEAFRGIARSEPDLLVLNGYCLDAANWSRASWMLCFLLVLSAP